MIGKLRIAASFCCVLICSSLCCSCGIHDTPEPGIDDISAISMDAAKPVKLFDSDYSVDAHSCMDPTRQVQLPFLPYGTTPLDLSNVLGVSKETFDATWTHAVENLDFSNLAFQFCNVPAYLNHVSLDEKRGYYDSVEIVIDYETVSREEVERIKTGLLADIEEIAPEKSVMQFTSVDKKTTIYCNVMPLEQFPDSPIGITTVTFFYNY